MAMNVNLIILAVITSALIWKRCSCAIPKDLEPHIHPLEEVEGHRDILEAFGGKDKSFTGIGKSRKYVITTTVIGAGHYGIIFVGFITQGKRKREAVAVKVEQVGENLQGTGKSERPKAKLPAEFGVYEKLGVVDLTSVSKNERCIPKVYHLEKDLSIGPVKVNAMFMQLLGMDFFKYSSTIREFEITMRESLITGLTLMECLETIQGKGFVVNDVKFENVLTGFGAGNLELFISDLGAASPPNEYIDHSTLVYATERFLKNRVQKKKTRAIRTDDIFSLLISLIDLLDEEFLEWMETFPKTTDLKYSKAIIKQRDGNAIEAACKRCDITGTLSKMWSMIKDNLNSENPPTKAIKKLFERGIKEYLRESIDLDWEAELKPPKKIVPLVRPTKVIEQQLSKSLRPLYKKVLSTAGHVFIDRIELSEHLINWGKDSLIFLGKIVDVGKGKGRGKDELVDVAIKIQQRPAKKLENQYEILNRMNNAGQGNAFFPRVFGYERNFAGLDIDVLIMDLLGPSIEAYQQSQSFSLETIDMISKEMRNILEILHGDFGIILNQLTPADILTGYGGKGLAIADFSNATDMLKPVTVPIDALTFAPDFVLKAINEKEIITSYPPTDHKWYSMVMLSFVIKLPWSKLDTADKILEARTGNNHPSKLCAQDKSGIICTYYDVIENDKPIDLKKLVLDNLIAIRVKNENDNFNTWRLKLKTPKGFVPVHDDKVKSSIKWLKG